jgi:hypothetical protein
MAQANEGDKDMKTGKPCKDPQMHALKKTHGTPVRQAELPPYISKQALPGEKD